MGFVPVSEHNDVIIMTREQFESQTSFQTHRAIVKIDKVVKNEKYALALEKDLGIHIVDVNDFDAPKKIGFLKIPGCEDLDVDDNDYLYIHSAVDLVVFDLNNLQVELRHRNFFEPRFDLDYPNVPEGSVAIRLIEK